jgi:ankyrin repeat protein
MRPLSIFAVMFLLSPFGHSQMLDAEAIQKNPNGALSYAVSSNDIRVARQAIDAGADVNLKASGGSTFLMWAASEDRTEIVKMLIDAKADVNKEGDGGYTPLICASKAGKPEIVKMLLNAGARVEAKTSKGYTPVILAGGSGNTDTVKVLIEAKADVNARSTTRGMTALIQSAMACNAEAARLLLEAGAKTETVDDQGKNALSYAQEMLTYGQRPESQAVIDLLKDKTPGAASSAQAPVLVIPPLPQLPGMAAEGQ